MIDFTQKIVQAATATIGGRKIEEEKSRMLRDGYCLTRGGEPHNARLVGTVGGGRIEFGDPRPFVAIGSIVASAPGRITFQTASARRENLNRRLIRAGMEPLPSLHRSSP